MNQQRGAPVGSDARNIDNHFKWRGWPKERQLPTLPEYNLAVERYTAALDPRDDSDYAAGLGLAMSQYNPLLWLGFFFPAEEREFHSAFRAMLQHWSATAQSREETA